MNTENTKVPQSLSVEPERGYPRGKMAEVEGCAQVRGRYRQELQSILALMFAFVCQFYRLLCVKKPAGRRHVW